MNRSFTLVLFSTNTRFIRQAVAAGVGAVIVDWENIGKRARQNGLDTEINHDTLADLQRVRACTRARVICRVNSCSGAMALEIEQAVAAGADEVLLPMVRTVGEVESALALAAGRCGVGILIETEEAVQLAPRLNRLPITRVYVGLNDLAIERRAPSIFTALIDGTVEQIRSAVTVPFGFGGLTLPDRGEPIPCCLLIGEMARLGCDFSFLRRSFHRDIQGRSLAFEIPNLHRAIQQARERPLPVIARQREALEAAVGAHPQIPALSKSG